MNRLHEYRYSDDIMRRNTIVPGGKKHANVSFVDFSGSMNTHLLGTMHQIINLAMFQRKAQIDFRVFTFGAETGRPWSPNLVSKDIFDHKEGDFAFYYEFTLREILSSKMSVKEFNEACVNLLLLANSANSMFVSLPSSDLMGGTPLNEAIVCAIPLVQEMYKNGAQFVSATFLTDGEATTHSRYVTDFLGSVNSYNIYTEDVYLHDEITKNNYKIADNQIDLTNQFLHLFRDRTGTKAIGFFICGEKSDQDKAFRNFLPPNDVLLSVSIEKLHKKLEEDFYVVATESGYNEFYILPSGNNLRINVKANPLSGCFTNAQMVTAMTEQGQKQRKQRVLLTRYIKLIS
jgi:hypothetical protein